MTELPDVLGARKAAAFLLSLERDSALELLRHFEEDVVSEIAAAMTELGDEFSDKATVDSLYTMMAKEINSPPKVVAANNSQLYAILDQAFDGERATQVLDEIRKRREQERPFAIIESTSPERLAMALSEERASSAAIVLSHLDPGLSADIISGFDDEFALATVTMMATLVPPGIETLKSIAHSLEQRLSTLSQSTQPQDPAVRLKTIAEMLNYASQDTERAVLEGLGLEDEEMVAEIREHMFTWTDLADVDKRSMQKILASVDTRTLAVALKACSVEVEENVTSNLSTRVKAMVVEERELAGAIPMSEVMAARAELLKAVHSLIDSGEFSPARGGEELVD